MTIRDLAELAAHVGAYRPTVKSIAHRLYKDTDCGISFWAPEGDSPDRVVVAGYAEGTDAECPNHELKFPFESDDFDLTVETADREGVELFEETHDEEGNEI